MALLRVREHGKDAGLLDQFQVGGLGGEELQEVDGRLRGAPAQGVSAAAAEHLGDGALAALDRGEREEAQVVAEALAASRPPRTGPTGP